MVPNQVKVFYPLFITGNRLAKDWLSSLVVVSSIREVVRVNVTIETDEDDLINGFRLINGETVWSDGPIIKHCVVVLFCCWMRLMPVTRSCVSNRCSKEGVKSMFIKS